jgi:hypothetical protein
VHEGLVSSEGLGRKAYQQSMVKPAVFFGLKIEMQVETFMIYHFLVLGINEDCLFSLQQELATANTVSSVQVNPKRESGA